MTIVAEMNPMKHILSRWIIGGEYSKWIVILQEFDLEFVNSKAKKSLTFAELVSELPDNKEEKNEDASWEDEHLFLIATTDPWYGTLITYLQAQRVDAQFSSIERRRIRYQTWRYLIIGDTLYRRGIDLVLRRYLVHEEAEKVLNDFHARACGDHLSGWETTQKILHAGYFWPILFKDCINVIKRCHPCQIYTRKMHAHPAPLDPVVTMGPFAKWAIDYMTINPPSSNGHHYIIVAMD